MLRRCGICSKKQKENTEGKKGYCQGHDFFSINDGVKSAHDVGDDYSQLAHRIFDKDIKGGIKNGIT